MHGRRPVRVPSLAALELKIASAGPNAGCQALREAVNGQADLFELEVLPSVRLARRRPQWPHG